MLLRNNAEGTADETTVTTANSATGGSAFDAVVTAGATLVFDTGQFAHGASAFRLATVASATASMSWTTAIGAAKARVYGHLYLRATDFTAVSLILARLRGAAAQAARITVDTAGRLQLRNGANSVVDTALVGNAMAVNTWYRIAYDIAIGASATSSLWLYAGDSSTLIEQLTAVANYGTNNIDEANFGTTNASANVPSYWLDELQINDTGVPGPALLTATIGQSTDTSTAQPFTRTKTVAIGQPSETSMAQTFGRVKILTTGQASETSTAQPFARTKTAALGQAVDTSTAQAYARTKSATVGQASDSSTAGTFVPSKSMVIGQAAETSTTGAFTAAKARTIGQAADTSAAGSLTAVKTLTIGQALEMDTAQPFTSTQPPGTIVPRPDTGTTARPATGTVTRPYTGVVTRP